jgi:carbon-monoxide dehydrogenase medium subunit
MEKIRFYDPETVAETLDLLEQYSEKAVIVNGGTDIVEKIAKDTISPEAIIYIQNIKELKNITTVNGYVSIGGAVTYAEIQASSVCQQFTALQDVICELGSVPIRVVATPAGNIGTASPAADCNVALIALGADIVISSKNGERVVAAQDMFVSYGHTQLRPDELIIAIRIPVANKGMGSAFLKLARRKAQDIAQVSTAVCIYTDGTVIEDVCIALGAVAPTTVRASSFEALIKGKTVQDAAKIIKDQVPEEAVLRRPRNKAYKEAVMGVLTSRAIIQAFTGVEGGEQ